METGIVHQGKHLLGEGAGFVRSKIGKEFQHLGHRPGPEHQRRVTQGPGNARNRTQRIHQVRHGIFIRIGIQQQGGVAGGVLLVQGGTAPGGGKGKDGLVFQISEAGKDGHKQHQQQITELMLEAGNRAEGQPGNLLSGSFHRPVSGNDEERKDGEDADEGEGDAFGEHQSQIGPYLYLDEAEHQQAHDGGEGAAEDGRRRSPDGPLHSRFLVFPQGFFLPVPVHQDDAVVHGQHHLQHRRKHIGHHGDAGQEGIGAHIQRHGKTGGQQEQHHFHHGRAHYQQHHKQHGNAYGQNAGQIGGHQVVSVGKQGTEFLHPALQGGQFLLHNVQSLLHRITVRQVLGHVRVDVDTGNHKSTGHHQDGHQGKDPFSIFHQKARHASAKVRLFQQKSVYL